jgi:hypothetical protein
VGRWAGGPVGRWAGGPVGRLAGGPVGRSAGRPASKIWICSRLGGAENQPKLASQAARFSCPKIGNLGHEKNAAGGAENVARIDQKY